MKTEQEKARAYDEALGRAKEMCITLSDKAISEYIFPELKESEDDWIRKDIKQHFLHLDDSFPDKAKWLAWLEKQGESSCQIHYWTEEEIEPIISDYLRGAEHYGGMIGRLRCLKPKSFEKQAAEQSPFTFDDVLAIAVCNGKSKKNQTRSYMRHFKVCMIEYTTSIMANKKKIDSMQEEPVSEDLEKEISCYLLKNGIVNHSESSLRIYVANVARHFAAWQLENSRQMPA